jgi:hypothetical protein
MKVKCINLGDYAQLTIGKIYDVSEYCLNEYYILINDQNIKLQYPKNLFKSILEIRINQINKLLN